MSILGLKRTGTERNRNFVKGLLFVSPWLVGFLAFTILPILASLYYSFMHYDIVRPPRFIGLANYTRMITEDKTFRVVLGNTLYFVLIGIPAGMVIAFLLASLLNNEMKGRPAFRTIFFLPTLVPAVASAEVWRWVYNSRWGLINSVLKSLGLSIVPFLSAPELAKPSLIIIDCWAQGTAMIIFLAALQDVPRSLYDSALVDGANALQRFWHITIPMCTPAILFIMLTSMIGKFQYFALGWLLTEGGPNQATEFYSIYLYRNAFVFFKMGYASALAWILFLIIVVSTIAMFRLSGRWVFYRGQAR
ncbi:Lactose transport system permease protein LacF [subsurface metagenome]